jgi:phage-related protein
MYNSRKSGTEKPLQWIGSSYKDLMALPPDVRRFFGFALSLAEAYAQELRNEKKAD